MRCFTVISLLVHMAVLAQPDITVVKVSKFYGGLNASVDLPYRRTGFINEIERVSVVEKNIRNAEGPMPSYTSSILFGYRLTRSIGVEIGVTYAVRNFSIDWSKVNFVRPVQYPWPQLEPVVVEDRWEMRHILIPVRGVFTVGEGRVRSVSTVGAAGSLFELGKAWPLSPYLSSALGLELHRFNVSATISTGAAIDMGRTSQLRIEPVFYYGLSPFSTHAVKTYLYTMGLNVGYFVHF